MSLNKLIEDKNITSYRLSKSSRVSQSVLSYLNNGIRKDIRLSTAKRLADGLGVTIDELYNAIQGGD